MYGIRGATVLRERGRTRECVMLVGVLFLSLFFVDYFTFHLGLSVGEVFVLGGLADC